MNDVQIKEAVKASIFVSVFVGIFIGVKTIFEQNLIAGIQEGLFSCVFLFCLSVIITLLINLILENYYPAKQTLELSTNYANAFSTCIESLKLFENTTILINEYSEGRINANLNNSRHIILFDIKTISNELTKVKVSSKPSVYLPAPIPTYSRNKEIVDKIIGFLNKKNNEIVEIESSRFRGALWK